jgi:Holliday junction resolvasome RuvABC endonuclease subunit
VRILALDLATRTGFATWDGAARRSGFVDLKPGRGESPGMLFVNFERWLQDRWVQDLPPSVNWTLIVYEQAFHMKSGYAAGIAFGLIGVTLKFCAERGIEHAAVNGARLKKWVTGDGAAKKERVVSKVVQAFFGSDSEEERARRALSLDHNEADAIALVEFARAEILR